MLRDDNAGFEEAPTPCSATLGYGLVALAYAGAAGYLGVAPIQVASSQTP